MQKHTIISVGLIIAFLATLFIAFNPTATAQGSQVAAVQQTYQPAGAHRDITVFWPGLNRLEQRVFEEVNQTRFNLSNVGETTWNQALSDVTRDHSIDMGDNEYFDHINLQGESPLDRAWDTWEQIGCKEAIGENLALIWAEKITEYTVTDRETDTVYTINVLDHEEIVDTAIRLWLDSDQGHRENMLDGSWTTTGVGVAIGNGVGDWYPVLITQNFCK